MAGAWVIFTLIFIPSIPIIAVYFWYRLARYQISTVRFLFTLLAGAAAFFPALVLQNLLRFPYSSGGRFVVFFEFFIRIALTEELSRLLVLFIFFMISDKIETTRMDALPDDSDQAVSAAMIRKAAMLGLVAGLGFSILESAVIGASYPRVLLLRAITAAPLHGACGSRIGAASVLLRSSPLRAVLRIITATAIHGVYNFMVPIPGFPSILALLIALSAFATSVVTIRGEKEAA